MRAIVNAPRRGEGRRHLAVPHLADSALADPAPQIPLRVGEVASPSALAPGEQYLSISKELDCGINTCTAEIKGRARK